MRLLWLQRLCPLLCRQVVDGALQSAHEHELRLACQAASSPVLPHLLPLPDILHHCQKLFAWRKHEAAQAGDLLLAVQERHLHATGKSA